MNPDPIAAEPLARARGIAVVGGVLVLALAAILGGRRAFVSAAAGSVLSFANVWALERFAQRAVAQAALLGGGAVAAPLTAALGAKTVVLLTASWVLIRVGGLETLPFGLGFMVSIFSLLGAGLYAAQRAE
ncbi:MAG TPA: hypothetical protein VKO16_07050 [Polyangia bacterium]|nr:hypothetical protein [Polyangia bacterium]